MKMKTTLVFTLLLAIVLSLGLSACSQGGASAGASNAESGTDNDGENAAPVGPGDVAGFEEFPLGDDIELGPLNVAGVYFQPVDMEPAGSSLAAADSDAHIEADISALQNDLGYGVGDFVPYLMVKYEIESEDGTKQEGTFMPMSASDGPHYGTNIKFGPAGVYTIRFIIENPEAQGYLLHVDQETGVEGRFWTEPLVAEWEFDWVPRVW
ncbi:MAG: iron transporter [Clostridiales bacterium]|jgi:uncharacterized protein involved in high-affinity Fe2+ transport|nr:iron transporter [Clostridiales bacterium]